MPYKASCSADLPEKRRRYLRGWRRTKRHGNWRQLVVDCDGLCALCKENPIEHFHDAFGENHKDDNRMQQRYPLCVLCHSKQHKEDNGRQDKLLENYAGRPSVVTKDVLAEMKECGSFMKWCLKYKVTPIQGIFSRIVWPNEDGEVQREALLL